MVSADDLAAFVHQPRICPGAGHNVQVEDPAWVASVLGDLVDDLTAAEAEGSSDAADTAG
jgi:pimeloyl-ACP methyl ester carboxylesterase